MHSVDMILAEQKENTRSKNVFCFACMNGFAQFAVNWWQIWSSPSLGGTEGGADSVPECNLAVSGIHHDGAVAVHMPGDNVAAQRVEQQILDSTLHGTSSKLGVIARLG